MFGSDLGFAEYSNEAVALKSGSTPLSLSRPVGVSVS